MAKQMATDSSSANYSLRASSPLRELGSVAAACRVKVNRSPFERPVRYVPI